MKLAIIKNTGTTLKQEVSSMNKFNVVLAMKRLVKTMLSVFAGITIPAIVFKSMDYMFRSATNGIISDYSGGITQTLHASVNFVASLSTMVVYVLVLFTVLKLIRGGDFKDSMKGVASIMIGYIIIMFGKLLPFVVPSVLRAMGLI